MQRVVPLTPENDLDQMFGDDPGYEAAAMLHDEELPCTAGVFSPDLPKKSLDAYVDAFDDATS